MKLTKRALLKGGVTALGFAALSGKAFAAEKTKIGFVLVGPKNDGGYSEQHYRGAVAMAEEYGDKVELMVQESVPEGADAERVLTQMALSGAKLIFTTSFGFMDATVNVAKKFPDVKFEHCTGYKTAPNLGIYSARFYEGRVVQGFLAGKMTKSNIVGYIASFPIPEVIRGINAAYIAAKKVNPDIQFKIIWAYTWFDPAKEGDAAKALIEQGADFLMQHTDSTAPQAVAQKAGNVYTFGQATDMAAFAPKPRITATIDTWEPYYIERVGALLDGTWKSDDTWGGIGSGMVTVGEISSAVPDDIKAEAEKIRDSLSDGSLHAFTGPLKKQDGSDWLAEGEVADDKTLLGMNFYVEGLEGEIPK
jgi:simple sugar transport system substrate-binding protein